MNLLFTFYKWQCHHNPTEDVEFRTMTKYATVPPINQPGVVSETKILINEDVHRLNS